MYAPESCQIYISGDVLFDESFGAAIATSWKMHQDSLSLHPAQPSIPTVDTHIEHTGSISDIPIITKEGNIETTTMLNTETDNKVDNLPQHEADDDSLPDLLHPDDDSSASNSEAELDNELEDKMEDEMDIAHNNEFGDDNISLQLLSEL